MSSHSLRLCILALFFAAAACSSKKNDDASAGVATATPAQGQVGATIQQQLGGDVSARAKQLGALVDLVVAEANDLPRAEFDPAALAAKLGKDPQAHFEWVRDHTWWAPYRGLLRGSKGVMLDRVGSNLDRTVLLGDLLRHAGYTVRLARAQLSETRAKELLNKVRPIAEHRRSPIASKPVSAARNRAVQSIIPGYADSLAAHATESTQRGVEAKALVNSQTDQLYAAVKDSAIDDGTADRKAVASMQDYWWVERSEGGKWVPMDVLLADSKMGEVLASAAQTSEWKSDSDSPSVPQSDWHTVRIQIVVERYASGAITESTVLDTVLRPAEVLERPITLTQMPKPWPHELPDPKVDPNAVGNAAVNVKEWVPFLQIGADVVAQSGVTDGGELIADPFNRNRGVAAAGGAGFMTGFDAALGGGDTPSSSMTAEWIDYEIRVPGESNERIRRPVFDLLGPTKRSAKSLDFDANSNERLIERYEALLGSTDILLQCSDFTGDFVAHLLTKSIVANQVALHELSRERDVSKTKVLASEISARIESWGPLPYLALWRSELVPTADAGFIDRPNILNYRVGQVAVNADRVKFRELIDVAANATGARGSNGRNPFEVRLRQGVADTVAEMLALGNNLRTAENTAAIFSSSGASAEHAKVIAPRDLNAVLGLGWSEDVAARLSEDVGAGFMAVALHHPVSLNERQRVGWWRVDPRSGETIGVMDNGYHSDTTEETIIENRNALREWLKDNAEAIREARAAANDPFTPVSEGQRDLIEMADYIVGVLRKTALAGF